MPIGILPDFVEHNQTEDEAWARLKLLGTYWFSFDRISKYDHFFLQ
jgi:hypothetical protein